ncbi:unnamed protein product [Camellia sinensis]
MEIYARASKRPLERRSNNKGLARASKSPLERDGQILGINFWFQSTTNLFQTCPTQPKTQIRRVKDGNENETTTHPRNQVQNTINKERKNQDRYTVASELPRDKWFCCDDCNRIHVALQNLVLVGAEMIPASVSYAIHRKHVKKGFTDGVSNDVQWRILSGRSRYLEHLPVLSRAAAIFRECFDPIVATSGRDLIPVMVCGRNISRQEFGGMSVVSASLLRIFGREVAELPLVATSRENQGKGYFQTLFSCIESLLYSLNVENLVLPVAEEAESIWTKKLGFRKMSDERLLKYTRNLQLMIFKGTSMLEKKVQQIAD